MGLTCRGFHSGTGQSRLGLPGIFRPAEGPAPGNGQSDRGAERPRCETCNNSTCLKRWCPRKGLGCRFKKSRFSRHCRPGRFCVPETSHHPSYGQVEKRAVARGGEKKDAFTHTRVISKTVNGLAIAI